jgi:hypothetical protein
VPRQTCSIEIYIKVIVGMAVRKGSKIISYASLPDVPFGKARVEIGFGGGFSHGGY